MHGRWESWHRGYKTGVICGDVYTDNIRELRCNLSPGHELPHQAWRGHGTVATATWPWESRAPNPNPNPNPGPAPDSAPDR